MSYALVLLRPDDAARIAEIQTPARPTPLASAESLAATSKLALGLETDDGALVAFVIASMTPDFADIEYVFVSPDHRRSGLGARLIRAIALQAGIRGVARLVLEVSEANIAARKLYASLGFETERIRANYYRDGSNALAMSRPVAGLGH